MNINTKEAYINIIQERDYTGEVLKGYLPSNALINLLIKAFIILQK